MTIFSRSYWIATSQALIWTLGLASFAKWVGPSMSFERLAVGFLMFRVFWLEAQIKQPER